MSETITINILAFGIAKDILGSSSATINTSKQTSVNELKELLEKQYPALQQVSSYMIARNNKYAEGTEVVSESDEIAIIPPVSGG